MKPMSKFQYLLLKTFLFFSMKRKGRKAAKMGIKHTTCVSCDGGCAVSGSHDSSSNALTIRPLNPKAPAICSKGTGVDEYRLHPSRITTPLKNTGTRGEPVWQAVGWDEALDEIATRLKAVIAQYGPESVGVSEMPLNHGFGGITRRLMNCIGTPNYIAPVELCMGNTAQVHRTTYGWYTAPDWEHTDLIVYFGQNRGPELWPVEYLNLKAALERGAQLIVIDPRRTETAELATHHLPIRYGTDAALALGWLNVIITENLYDHGFVASSCTGFDELAQRVQDYPPEKVAAICGVGATQIRETARAYALAKAAIIPWSATCDMQRNSTSVLRAQCILRAICGFINKSENVYGPGAHGISNTTLADFSLLPADKQALQLGADTHPLLTHKAAALYDEVYAAQGITCTPDIMALSYSAVPTALFAAMRGEGPYPVKAFFSLANNTVMSYAGQQGIIDAFMNQDLVVVFENNMTPTAQLADYVLPGDMWAERDVLGPQFDVAPAFTLGQKIVEPTGECRDWYSVVKGLADRLGYTEQFPWKDCYELYDYRLAPLGKTWAEASAVPFMMDHPFMLGKFLTPSGKVELKSSVLEKLGLDPLPYYTEHGEPGINTDEYPFVVFAGSRDRCSYNTNHHHIPSLRKREPEPELYINPASGTSCGLEDGQWAEVTTTAGSLRLLARFDERQPAGTLRIPHGWWKPETTPGLAAGLSSAQLHNDGILFTDAEWNLDPEQGLANLRGGLRAKISVI